MSQKIKIQKGFIQIPLLVAIIAFVIVATGTGYGGFEYYKTSKIIKEAKQLTKEEKYNEAIGKLELAQNKLLGKIILKQKISTDLESNKKLLTDKTRYDEGVNKLNEGSLQESIDSLSELPESSFYYQKAQTKIEESKRKMVEGELSEEQIARKGAEAKAKQEEFEKKLKEQQLAGKEAEEKMMNADNDGDGLTYREELSKGTSDFNRDSDGDGINDKEDTNPAGGGSNMTQVFNWSYGDYNYKTEAAIHDDWFNYYKAKKPRANVRSVEYVTYNDPFIKAISNEISKVATDRNNPCKTCFATAFVHSISYIDDKYTGYDEYPRYPVETIMQKTGDCEDTSYLTASILEAMNIDTVLILLPGHMAVGVWVDCNNSGTYYKLNDKCYYYIETTGGKDWTIGEIPPDAPHTPATLIKIPSGELVNNVSPQYKKPCYVSKDFSGYYSDGKNFYSDSQCNYQITCLLYKEYYFDTNSESFYWDGSCSQIVVKGCYKSISYPGYFYRSGLAWYYDSQCLQIYQSMTCNYPYSYIYSCTSEYSYSSKKSTCDYYASSTYLKDLAQSCYDGLAKCRSDINEYQSKLNEYNSCLSSKEY
jgi:hypothetical protein